LQVVVIEESVAWREMLCDRKNSNWYDSETQENTHMGKVGGRKRKESAIFD
jgi:hypothetical protein